MIAALWGLFLWKEFKGASQTTKWYLGCMFLFYVVGFNCDRICKNIIIYSDLSKYIYDCCHSCEGENLYG